MIYLIAFTSVVFYAGLCVIAKVVGKTIPDFVFMAITMAGLCAISCVAAVLSPHKIEMAAISSQNWALMGLFAAMNFIGFALYLYCYRAGMPIVNYQLFNSVTPVVAGLIAYFALGEPITYKALLGAVIMGIGLYIAIK